ncbi:MAG: T9SS type A sorting domain-containing protein [Candidatus Delongbacteria bacterium]|nr:T9SS type A sorting domain-containing protein [Candidatus Delongbacteria bacterium]MBN2835431.1 T9SS type A sorting domain-containing protein [Candidatus Delongbacteria bacterium]
MRFLCLVLILMSINLSASYWHYRLGGDFCFANDINEISGGLIVGAMNLSIYNVSRSTWVFTDNSLYSIFPFEEENVLYTSCKLNESLYFSTENNRFFVMNSENILIELSGCPVTVNNMVSKNDFYLLASTPLGVYIYDTNNDTWDNFGGIINGYSILGLVKNSVNKIYAFTNSKIYYLEGECWIEQNNLPVSDLNIKSISFDKYDNQFILTDIGIFIYKSMENSWNLVNEGIENIDYITDIKALGSERQIYAYGYHSVYKFGQLGFWQNFSPGAFGWINSIFLAFDDYLYLASDGGVFKSNNQFSYQPPTTMNLPPQIEVKQFGITKLNLPDFIQNEDFMGFIPGNLSWQTQGSSNYHIQRVDDELQISRIDEDYIGSQNFIFTFNDTINNQVISNNVDLNSELAQLNLPDVLYVQSNPIKTDFDLTPFIIDVDSSASNLGWSTSQDFDISKDGQTLIIVPKTVNWQGSECVTFYLSNSKTKNNISKNVLLEVTNTYEDYTIKPLHIGNKYFFKAPDYSRVYEQEVIKDTIVDGYKYFIISGNYFGDGGHFGYNGRWMERSNNSKVFSNKFPLDYTWKVGQATRYGYVQSVNTCEYFGTQYQEIYCEDIYSSSSSSTTRRLKFINFFGPVYHYYSNYQSHGEPGWSYTYNLIGATINGENFGVVDITENGNKDIDFEIKQNYPNPFNPTTNINYSLNNSSLVKLSVYNSNGELVVNLIDGKIAKGFHSVRFDASNLNSGVYFYKIEVNGVSDTRKMILVK